MSEHTSNLGFRRLHEISFKKNSNNPEIFQTTDDGFFIDFTDVPEKEILFTDKIETLKTYSVDAQIKELKSNTDAQIFLISIENINLVLTRSQARGLLCFFDQEVSSVTAMI